MTAPDRKKGENVKYSNYRKLGKYQAELKWCASRLQEKDNSSFVAEFSEKACLRLQEIVRQQALDSAWNTYHNINRKAADYNPHEKEILEEIAHMKSSEDGWKVADDMLSVCNSLKVPWYAKGRAASLFGFLILLFDLVIGAVYFYSFGRWFVWFWIGMAIFIMISVLNSHYLALFKA